MTSSSTTNEWNPLFPLSRTQKNSTTSVIHVDIFIMGLTDTGTVCKMTEQLLFSVFPGSEILHKCSESIDFYRCIYVDLER